MSNTLALAFSMPLSLWARFLAMIDRALMESAEAALAINEPTYFGL